MLDCRNKVRKTELGHTELSGQINKLTLIKCISAMAMGTYNLTQLRMVRGDFLEVMRKLNQK